MLQDGKLEIIESEMEKLDINIFSETHKRENGHLKTDNGNTLFMASIGEESRNEVAIRVRKGLEGAIIGYETVSDRVVSIKISTKPCILNLVQVYAPTSLSTEEELDNFYSQLDSAVQGIPSSEVIMVQECENRFDKRRLFT